MLRRTCNRLSSATTGCCGSNPCWSSLRHPPVCHPHLIVSGLVGGTKDRDSKPLVGRERGLVLVLVLVLVQALVLVLALALVLATKIMRVELQSCAVRW